MKTYGRIGMMAGLALLCACALFTGGCLGGGGDGGDGGSDNAGSANVAGTWNGSGVVGKGSEFESSGPTQLVLHQDGGKVSGTWDGDSVSGLLEGDVLTLNIKPFTEDGMTFTGGMSGKVDGDKLNMSGTFSGTEGGMTVDMPVEIHVTRSGGSVSGVLAGDGGGLSQAARKAIAAQRK